MGECLIIRSGGGTDTSGATATASVVLAGYTCYVNDNKITGSMPAQTLNRTLNAGGSVTIPAGYYDGSSVISTSTLAGETAANAASSHILSGYNAWVNGSNTWGNMPNRGNIYHSLPANGTYTVPAGWHAGGGVVNQSLAFHWGGTYTPNTANQVICWANWYAAGNIVVLGSSALTAGNIRNGVWIFGVLGNFAGWVDDVVSLYNRGPGFNNVYNFTYFGSRRRNGNYDSSEIYPSFYNINNVWCLRLYSEGDGDGHQYWSILYLWFYDQIGKIPNMNVIKPWFYTSNATHTDPWFRPEANGGSSLFTVVYNGTTDSVSRIQSKYWSDKNQFGGNLQGGRGYVSDDNRERSAGYASWYAGSVIPMKPNYSVELTVQDSGYFGRYTWTGQVEIYCQWREQAVRKFFFDRIDYRPVK